MKMIFFLFVLTVAWCGAVWFALPIDLTLLDPARFVLLHLAPPVVVVLSGVISSRARRWNVERRKKAREEASAAREQARKAADEAERETELARRRAFFDCRAVWLAVPRAPDWFVDGMPQCSVLEQDADALRRQGREAALSSSLREVFEAALSQCEALAYLPLYLLPDHEGGTAMELVGKVWQEALSGKFQHGKNAPVPDCRRLPGADEPLSERVLALFEAEPAMPAMWLIGMDSLLAEGAQADDGGDDSGIEPGHAVAALVLSRPDLVLVREDAVERPDDANPYPPYWERGKGDREAGQWGKVPPSLRIQLWGLLPFARLHRSRALSLQGDAARIRPRARQLQGLIESVLIDAGLLELPPSGGGEARASGEPDVEYLFHNSGAEDDPAASNRLVSITTALRSLDCCMDLDRACNVLAGHGETGDRKSVV